MRAVTGTVVSSKPISLSKAAKTLSRFAASETAAASRPEAAAYLRRASAAFDELVRFHREIRDGRKQPELGSPKSKQDENQEKRKRKRKADELEAAADGVTRGSSRNYASVIGFGVDGAIFGSQEARDGDQKKKKRTVAGDEERSNFFKNEKKNVVAYGGGAESISTVGVIGSEYTLDVKRDKTKEKKYKEKRQQTAGEEERRNLYRKEDKNVVGDEDSNKRMKHHGGRDGITEDNGVVGLEGKYGMRKKNKEANEEENNNLRGRAEKMVEELYEEEKKNKEEKKLKEQEKNADENERESDRKHRKKIKTKERLGNLDKHNEQNRKKKKRNEERTD